MEDVDRAADLIEQADALVIVAGAGMGVDSGLPDFRGDTGFWKAYPALGQAGISFSEIASPRTFRTDPALAWGFYGHRLALYRDTTPHPGFQILRRWADRMFQGSFVFTSNVDGHFQRAGFAAEDVHECHGSIHWLQCLRPCCTEVWSADDLKPTIDVAACRLKSELPLCPKCESTLRPDILMFNDFDWLAWRYDAQLARLNAWLRKVERPVIVELGAGTMIPSARIFSHSVLRDHGGRLIRINPREANVPTPQDVGLDVGALAGLGAIDEALRARGE
jgi:NAD-dependent SIR2 family protein deacetylase